MRGASALKGRNNKARSATPGRMPVNFCQPCKGGTTAGNRMPHDLSRPFRAHRVIAATQGFALGFVAPAFQA